MGKRRDRVTTAMEIVGGSLIVAGIALVTVPLAVIVGGVGLIYLGWALAS